MMANIRREGWPRFFSEVGNVTDGQEAESGQVCPPAKWRGGFSMLVGGIVDGREVERGQWRHAANGGE
jgi:hypothetical protein